MAGVPDDCSRVFLSLVRAEALDARPQLDGHGAVVASCSGSQASLIDVSFLEKARCSV